MAVDERFRQGPDAATTLIEHLPPVGWADIATRHDLVALEQRMEVRADPRSPFRPGW